MRKNGKKLFAAILPALLLMACAPGNADAGKPDAAASVEIAAPADAPADAAYDRAAYEAAVNAVLEEYAQLNRETLESYDEAAHPELPWYTAIVANTERNSLFYGFWDFDGNGVPELVIAAGDESFQQPMGLYAFDGSKMCCLCKEQALGERAILCGPEGGLFAVRASGGAASGSVTFYRIAPDGFSTEIVEMMDYEYQDERTVIYTPQLGHMTTEEFERYELLPGLSVPVEYTLFASRQGPELANPWSEAATAEEAAALAGLEGFVPPEYINCFPGGYEGPAFRAMQGLVEAAFSDGSNSLAVRKGAGEEDVSGDYNDYPESREINWKGLPIRCDGADGEIRLARWTFGGNAYSLSFNPGREDLPGLSESDVTSLVNQIQ